MSAAPPTGQACSEPSCRGGVAAPCTSLVARPVVASGPVEPGNKHISNLCSSLLTHKPNLQWKNYL